MQAAVMREVTPSKTLIGVALKKRFYLRLHMFLILGGTIVVGVAATNALHAISITWLPFRYGLSVLLAFAAFVGFVRLWLGYVAFCAGVDRRRAARTSNDAGWFDCIGFSSNGVNLDFGAFSLSSSDSSDVSSSVLKGGGGKFGGGGATGSWGSPAQANANPAAAMMATQQNNASGGTSSRSSVSSSNSSGSGKSSGFGLDLGDDFGIIVLVIVLVVVIACAAFYLIWIAPVLLTEIVFQTALAASLARKTHKMASGEWMGSVVRSTALPFVLVFAAAVALGWYAQNHCPAATTLTEAMHCIHPDR